MAPLPRGLCALVVLGLALSRPSAASRTESPNSAEWWRTGDFAYIGKSAERLRREGDYSSLEKLYRHAIAEAQRAGNPNAQISYWTALGNTYVFLYRYAEAVDAYSQAREFAKAIGDWPAAGAVAPGLSSIYLFVGDLPTARETVEQGIEAVRRSGTHPYYETQLKLQYARLNAGTPSVIATIWDAIDAARLENNAGFEAQAWDLMGEEYSRLGNLEAEEHAFSEAYRLRLLLRPKDLRLSYWRLGSLRLAQGRLDEAELLTEKAISANASAGASLSDGAVLHQRGMIHQAQGLNDTALRDFEMATNAAETWRAVVPSAQSARTAADVQLDRQVFRSFIGAAARRALTHSEQGWASKAFLAIERNRAYSLRPLPSYSTGIRKSPDKLESFPTGTTLIGFQQGLRDSELLLSFYTEAEESYLWAVSRESLHLYRLPSAGQLRNTVERFQAALLKNDAEASQMGAGLYASLFGQLTAQEAARHSWMLSLDGPLFDLPFAALRTPSGSYIVESHSLQITPSAAFLRGLSPHHSASEFLGVGDAIYNSADERLRDHAASVSGQLNRLVASGEEISRSSKLWPGQVKLLSGLSATRQEFLESLAAQPAAIHLATHVIAQQGGAQAFTAEEVAAQKAQASIAFSLGREGRPEILTTPDVAALQVNGALVVMTGCSSGTGEIRPGAGLLGLTRAWLAAGADAVLATGWPVEDSRGDLLPVFYREISKVSAAEALRRSQVAMIHSGTWQSAPGYWAAFQLTGGAR